MCIQKYSEWYNYEQFTFLFICSRLLTATYCDCVYLSVIWYSWSCSLRFWIIITMTYSTKWARHDSSCIGEIKLAHMLRNNCEYLRNNCEYLIHNRNNLYNNIRRADKLTSMTSFVAGCISIEPICVYNHLGVN